MQNLAFFSKLTKFWTGMCKYVCNDYWLYLVCSSGVSCSTTSSGTRYTRTALNTANIAAPERTRVVVATPKMNPIFPLAMVFYCIYFGPRRIEGAARALQLTGGAQQRLGKLVRWSFQSFLILTDYQQVLSKRASEQDANIYILLSCWGKFVEYNPHRSF